MRQGHSYWDDRNPPARRPKWPKWKPSKDPADSRADIVVVGGGLTGATCAYAFAAEGYDVILLEANRVASGATAGSAGVLLPAFDATFAAHDARHGRRASRAMWQQARKGALDFAALLRRLRIRCDLDRASMLTVSRDAKAIGKEHSARAAAGVPATRVTGAALMREAAIEGRVALRTPDVFTFDPVRATLGLASHAEKQGARLFEQSTVTRIRRKGRSGVEVKTGAGVIAADAVVVATGSAGALVPQLRRHFTTHDTYAVVTGTMTPPMRRSVGSRKALVMDDETPPHTVRWLKEDRVLVSGADQPAPPSRGKDRVLVQRTGQLLYELSLVYPDLSGIQPAFAWDTPVVSTLDGAPYVGTHRNLPGHLFALGFGRHGDGLSLMAARALVRYHRGAPTKDDAVFGFTRHDS